MNAPHFHPLPNYHEYPPAEMQIRAAQFALEMTRRRSVRQFSDRPVPAGVLESCLTTALSAPSGANLQPWHFVVVRDPALKRNIRQEAEKIEAEFYQHRASADWLAALQPFGTDYQKPFLETAPVLIVIFAEIFRILNPHRRVVNYYVQESVGIATGMLITALHHAGLVTLTHTPSPMKFLNRLLQRPKNERPFLVLVVGYPAVEAQVPDLRRKDFVEVVTWFNP
ncbi:nitroreductase family protein [candidate division KSB1 bacterium]|nr:nitroreductase family protein [candidate division KSB1 bacterium]